MKRNWAHLTISHFARKISPCDAVSVPELLSHYSKKFSFSFHNVVRQHMILCEDMLWCASQARQRGYSYRSRRIILTRNLGGTVRTCGSAPGAGDSKWGMARCCHIKEHVKTFHIAASSHFPLRISSFWPPSFTVHIVYAGSIENEKKVRLIKLDLAF